ncbi:MAG TPA: OmpA family protein [Flavobacteriales bacterium]
MMVRRLSSLLIILLPVLLSAQSGDRPFDKENILDPDALKRALAAMKQGDALAAAGGLGTTEALARYSDAYAVNPENAALNMKMGLCHLNGAQRHKALSYFQQALRLDPNSKRIHFLLGFAYQLNGRWDEAIGEYETQRAITQRSPDPERIYNMADKFISECRHGKAYSSAPTRAQVRNLGPRINGPTSDYGVAVSPSGDRLFFTSRRSSHAMPKLNKQTNEPFEDVFLCERGEAGWSDPKALPAPVGTAGNDACVGLFNEGRTLILYRDDKGPGDLYQSTLEGSNWSVPVPFGPSVNSPAHEASAWYSADGEWLYFSSDREGGLGGLDIWRAPFDATSNTFGAAENLGPTINTQYDEDGVFMAADGRTMYFGSKGHTTMGGFDVFRASNQDGKWSKPENLGWPVNSADDDLFFVLTADGHSGYFSSIRPDGLGQDDLYRVDLLPMGDDRTASAAGGIATDPEDPEMVALIKGFIKSLKFMAPIEATIEVLDLDNSMLVANSKSDASGAFALAVPYGGRYAVSVRASGHLLHSESIAPKREDAGGEKRIDISMRPAEEGFSEVLRNIFWENDRADLAPASMAELGQLLAMLREQPKLHLEIGGHTDDTGTESHNQELSNARAQAVMDHLVANGIAPERLEAKGYGSSKPLVPNDTPEHKAMNRRTEMRVL